MASGATLLVSFILLGLQLEAAKLTFFYFCRLSLLLPSVAFARAGAAGVLLTGRRRAPLDESRALLAAAAPQCRVCVTQCDNRQPDQCDAVAALALSEFGYALCLLDANAPDF